MVKSKSKVSSDKQGPKKISSAHTQRPASSQAMQLRAIADKQTKMQILRAISEVTGLPIAQVREVFLSASHLAKCHLIKNGSGEFTVPEMAIKVVRKTKPATKQRQGRNPLTGETIMIPAKPKREIIRVKPLKSLKEVLPQK
jgi:nucleoid DNA-binding protein